MSCVVSVTSLTGDSMRFSSNVAPQDGYPPPQHHHVGHAHFGDRALSRRKVLVAGAGGAVTAAAVLGVTQWHSGLAKAAAPVPAAPKPIPQTIPGTPFHVLFPGQG